MRIKLLYAFLCLLLIIFTLNRNSYDGTRSVYNPIPQITLPEGINHLFDNWRRWLHLTEPSNGF